MLLMRREGLRRARELEMENERKDSCKD